ncbi:MAG: hypothetical protein KatS3mg085_693 [Candidatus Dojkabacteria bacterium]|nr:MAG: hypothetical protein KatS3mg085_693 [Candidatus Dojkabacteria bacterium]
MKYFKLFKILSLVLLVGCLAYFLLLNNHQADIPNFANNSNSTVWWNDDFAFRKSFYVNDLNKIAIKINHADLTISGYSQTEGDDLQVVFWDGKEHQRIETTIINPFSNNTLIEFLPIEKGEYYLYFGNKSYIQDNKPENNQITDNIIELNLENFEHLDFSVTSKKNWILYDSLDNFFYIDILFEPNLDKEKQYYLYDNETKEAIEIEKNLNLLKVPLDKIYPGQKYFSILAYFDDKVVRSNNFRINISYPLFVAWTVNWEGTDPGSENQSLVDKISKNYSLPVTHFFNPRVLIKNDITEARKIDIVNWLIERREKQKDEVALHLHMHHDMLLNAGVKTIENVETWNGDLRGYDTPPTVYSYEDFKKLLAWSLDLLNSYNLNQVNGFRSGGWFANEEILRAVEDSGFKYDSSSITPFEIGKNKFIQDWNINPTSQPYFPSYTNKNLKNGDMKLMEIPTNGGESLYSPPEKLIENFYQNYSPNTTLNSSNIIVFASNIDWFYQEEPKINILFEEIQKYRYELDRGPVCFVTIQEYLTQTQSL